MPRGIYERHTRQSSQRPLAGEDLTSLSSGGDTIKVHVYPFFRGEDKGDGGVRRVVEAQSKWFPKFGIELVEDPGDADLLVAHIDQPESWDTKYPHIPTIACIHGAYWSEYTWGGGWFHKANEKVFSNIRSSTQVIVPTEWLATTFSRHTSRKMTVIPHGVDMEDWDHSLEPRDYVLWNKTRPDPVCDPEPLNQVAKLLPQVKFITTFGNEANNVAVTGKLPYEQAKLIVQQAGIYLCTTKETFGIGTLEAMASGVPIVGYAWGGQVEIVRNGLDGFLVPPGDVHSLALAIEGALHDRALLSKNAKERAAEFSWERAAEAYANLFRQVLADHSQKRPKVSVIVTAYNLDKYLPDALESVRTQTSDNWECIVVDDNSPDTCGEIAEEYAAKDPRFRVLHNEQNLYLAEARNAGIRLARGRYILPLDADDILPDTAISLLSDSLDSDKSIHVAYGRVKFVQEDGITPTVYEGFRDTPGHSSWPWNYSFEQNMMQRNLLPYASMFRREAWEQTGGYRPRCRTAEDADFWTRLASYGFRPKKVTDADCLIYRNRKDSMSREQGEVDWIKWFPWSRDLSLAPAGACTETQLPVPALDNPQVAVIIPVGPEHRTLVKDAIDSVEAQSYRDFECIVINDSGRPLDELPTWVKVIDTEGKTGVAHARNLGIKASTAPLFLPLDADDYLQPTAIQWLLEAYTQTKDIIFPDFFEDPHTPNKFSVYHLRDYDPMNLTKGTLHCVTALTPKSAWEAVGGYDESLPAWEDWSFQIACADKGICSRRIAAPLFVYRKHTGLRRNANVADFEVSKGGILSKWSDLWSGRKQLMACSSCGARSTIKPAQSLKLTAPQQVARLANGEDAQLVQYIGDRRGNIAYKGKSGTFYSFSAGSEPRYILSSDMPMFQNRPEFKIVTPESLATISTEQEPVLVAEGKPSQ